MNAFEQAGEAMLLAEEGKVQMARAIVAQVQKWIADFRSYLGHLPTNLPPTDTLRLH